MSRATESSVGEVPIVTLDGPGGVGKGEVAKRIAAALDWHYLDSGLIYRLLGWHASEQGVDLEDASALAALAGRLAGEYPRLEALDADLLGDLRSERISALAARIAPLPEVRSAVMRWQHRYIRPPGLVADGRDMGSVVFAGANCKIFLTASAQERVRRRYEQLRAAGSHVKLNTLSAAMEARDRRDRERVASPLRPAPEAVVLETTELSIEQVVAAVLAEIEAAYPHIARR